MNNTRFVILSIIVLIFASGCATRRQVQELRIEVQAIRSDLYSIRAENARLDSLIRSNMDQSRKLNADFAAYVSMLDERMQMVEARLEDAVTLINRATGAIESRTAVRPPPTSTPDSAAVDTNAASGHMDCQKIYNSAYRDVVMENYNLAVSSFESYVENCSKTALADNARYWIGECYYLQKKYGPAEKAFQQMIEDYPKSERLASAKLKLGKSMYNQRFKTKAKSVFEEVVKNYPGTEEAGEAAQMLERYR